jgi:hypothetical protein
MHFYLSLISNKIFLKKMSVFWRFSCSIGMERINNKINFYLVLKQNYINIIDFLFMKGDRRKI